MKNFITEKRKALGMTQRDLASLLGVHYQVLQRWESGDRNPTVDIAIQLSRILHVTVEELFVLDNTV